MITQPGAEMLDSKLFVSRLTDPFPDLYERWWDGVEWVWVNHGRPQGVPMRTAPGAAMMDEKLFVVVDDGRLFERHWRDDLGRWAWQDHDRPPDTAIVTAPGAPMMASKLFVGTLHGHLFERLWTGAEWTWVDHGTAFHDQSAHVIGAPGSDPKLTVAIMGDGYTEADIDDYRDTVDDRVVRAFERDQLGEHLDKLRVVRIDVMSPESGVHERRYDERDTTEVADDVIVSEEYRFSRLGYIASGAWSHCWIEESARTEAVRDSIRRRFAPDATQVVVIVNSGKPGGCNRGNVAAFTRAEDTDTVAHELGHNLFDLGDEYNNDDRRFEGVTNDANLSERPADWSQLKWISLVAPRTPLPTDEDDPPDGWDDETSVGAFEGGGGNFATGIFRPVLRCRMNQNSPPWCPVCAREIDRIMGRY